MTRCLILLFSILALLPAAARADAYSAAADRLAGGLPEGGKVCVLPFLYIGAGPGSRGGRVVSERLYTELIKDGRLKVLERALIEEILEELKLKGGAPADEAQAAKAGRLLGADYVVTGSLFKKKGGAIELNTRAIEVGTGLVKTAVKTAIKEDWMEKFPEPPGDTAGSEAFKLCRSGMYALDRREFEQAAELFTKAIAAEENGGCGMNIPGMAYMARAMAYQNKAGPQDDPEEPSGPASGFAAGEQDKIKGAAGQYDKQLARYSALIKTMPDNAEAYFERGTIYAKLRRYREARRDLDAAIRLEAGKPKYYLSRAYALAMLGLYDNSLRDYDAAIRLDPGYAKAYAGRGNIYDLTAQYAKALASFAKAIELDPAEPLYYVNHGRGLANLGRYGAALKDCDKAVGLAPAMAEAHYWRGSALTGLKRYDEAVAAFDRTLELIPGDQPALAGRAEALDRKNGKFDKYDRDMKKARQLFDARETD